MSNELELWLEKKIDEWSAPKRVNRSRRRFLLVSSTVVASALAYTLFKPKEKGRSSYVNLKSGELLPAGKGVLYNLVPGVDLQFSPETIDFFESDNRFGLAQTQGRTPLTLFIPNIQIFSMTYIDQKSFSNTTLERLKEKGYVQSKDYDVDFFTVSVYDYIGMALKKSEADLNLEVSKMLSRDWFEHRKRLSRRITDMSKPTESVLTPEELKMTADLLPIFATAIGPGVVDYVRRQPTVSVGPEIRRPEEMPVTLEYGGTIVLDDGLIYNGTPGFSLNVYLAKLREFNRLAGVELPKDRKSMTVLLPATGDQEDWQKAFDFFDKNIFPDLRNKYFQDNYPHINFIPVHQLVSSAFINRQPAEIDQVRYKYINLDLANFYRNGRLKALGKSEPQSPLPSDLPLEVGSIDQSVIAQSLDKGRGQKARD